MPESIVNEMWALIPTVIYFFVGLGLFGFGIWTMEKITPFSIRKEIEEDQNIALAVIIGSMFIGIAMIISAAIT